MHPVQDDLSIELHGRLGKTDSSSLDHCAAIGRTVGKSPRLIGDESFMGCHSRSDSEARKGEQMLEVRVLFDQQYMHAAMKGFCKSLSSVDS